MDENIKITAGQWVALVKRHSHFGVSAEAVRADVVTGKQVRSRKSYGNHYFINPIADVVYAGTEAECRAIVEAAYKARDAWLAERRAAKEEFDRVTMPARDKLQDANEQSDRMLDTYLAAIVPAALPPGGIPDDPS